MDIRCIVAATMALGMTFRIRYTMDSNTESPMSGRFPTVRICFASVTRTSHAEKLRFRQGHQIYPQVHPASQRLLYWPRGRGVELDGISSP